GALTGLELPRLSLTLPLGISFYTFQTMSYTIDVYRGKVQPEHNIIDFGAFVVLFPQLIAGPIVKYSDVARELKERKFTADTLTEGVRLFIMGLGSKVLIANNVGALWTEIEGMEIAAISTPLAWLGALAFSLQIYFDFSGYSLMAIGLGRMLGFHFPQNFNYPYTAVSITDFWRRWHMTLSSWFREYLYFPLGGSREGKWKTYRNLLIVWAATGFWHGASWNFVLWGLFFFVMLVLEKAFLGKYMEQHRVVSRIWVLFLLMVSWMLFAITDLGRLGAYFTRMFLPAGGGSWLYYLRNYGVSLLLGCILSVPVLKKLYDRFLCRHKWLETALLFCVLALSTAYLVDATYNPFLYFRF
ncbi:MAG: MBOAT family protein, partial [Oscillospiraceae bacterium]|nr:MBOAT family protein [Oscillospiraceae bacterium]